jgi:hypothetical protein
MTMPVSAQSLFATRGMGIPTSPVDARARALGGIGIGLLGLNTSLVNPAEIAGFLRRGVSASLQPSTTTTEIEGATGDLAGARFPMIRLIYPFSTRFTASVVKLFKEFQVDSIVVVDGDRPCGALDIQDLVKLGLLGQEHL